MTTARGKQSLGLAALAATSTLGAWFMYKQFKPKRTKKSHLEDEDGPFDGVSKVSRSSQGDARSISSISSLESNEIEEVWTEDGDVDINSCRQLLLQKKQTNCHSSKVTLFSHLLSKLEQTLDDRDRIQHKLNGLRETAKEQVTKPTIKASPADKVSPPVHPNNETSVCMVVQRYRGATIMCDENEYIQVGKSRAALTDKISSEESQSFCGLMVYVSFAKGCTQQTVKTASKIIVNLPILTTGGWGDGAKTMNVVDLAKLHSNSASLVIVPQANLINKVKREGKSIQYHGQIDKAEGKTLYHYFVNSVRGSVLEQQCSTRKETLPEWYQKSCSAQSGASPQRASPSTLPEDLFRDTSLYASWDDDGIPLTDAEDEPITKSAQKKMRKAQAAHRVRHLKWQRDQKSASAVAQVTPSASAQPGEPQQHKHVEHWATAIDPSFVQVVAGTFGKRQSLQFVADMGPFCHVVQI